MTRPGPDDPNRFFTGLFTAFVICVALYVVIALVWRMI